jgi:hypothetical protein
VTRLIKEGADRAGEDHAKVLGRGNNIKTFRESYALGFWGTLEDRLRNLALARGEADKGLVLASLKQQVDDLFFDKYPHLRPRPAESGRKPYIAPNANCEKCAKAKSGYCREHGHLRPRSGGRSPAFNYGAYDAGGDAARTVDLGRAGTPKAEQAPSRREL